jgi:type II secretory pathway component PulK
LAVLWVLVSATVLALGATLIGREAFDAARNRVNAERAFWRAEDCLARSRATIDNLLSDAATPDRASSVWRSLDKLVAEQPVLDTNECRVELTAAGARIDINGPESILRASLAFLYGMNSEPLVDAILDWRDPDATPRPLGAEAAWYATQVRAPPRNDSFADVRELSRVRGFETVVGVDSIFSVEPGRISIANASAPVLAGVPGFTPETVERIERLRNSGIQVTDLLALTSGISQISADSLIARFPDISRLTTLEPDAWILTSRGMVGLPADTAVVEIRIVRAFGRASIMRRRSW